MRRRLSLLMLLALFALGSLPAPVDGATLHTWKVFVERARDGDSIEADIPGDGMGVREIRMIGIQATEYGKCHYDQAKARMRQLVEGKWVVLKAKDPDHESRGRPLRYVYLGDTDVGSIMLKEGRVMPFPMTIEPLNSRVNLKLAQIAKHHRVAPMWDDDACGRGPGEHNPLKVVVKWDADGWREDDNVNGEYVRIRNLGDTALSMRGWILRDSSHTQYAFPSAASIPAHGFITVKLGKGTDTPRTLYWGLSRTIFANIDGDGAYLVDPHGDIRASMIFRCYAYCYEKAKGRVNVRRYSSSVHIRNVSSRMVNLRDTLLIAAPYSHDLGRKHRLSGRLYPGETMKIIIGKGTPTRLRRYWPRPGGLSGTVQLRTFDHIYIDSD